ncbi:MAG: TonB C-terminal domain-containing protein [Campylobacterales bacterium]|nr:TonB C-terminal domain-containing protein [Campylobacterales bacterium]
MTENRSWISAVAALCVYFFMLFMLIYYFNHHDRDESKNYVKKDQKKISVSLNSPQKKVEPKPKEQPKPPKETPKVVKKETPKVVKKEIQESIAKPKDLNITQPKEIKKIEPKKEQPKPKKEEPKPKKETPKVVDTNDLFKDIKTEQKPEKIQDIKPDIKVSEPKKVKQEPKKSASDLVDENKPNEEDAQSGIENEYIAKLKERLSQWSEQEEYKGETAVVEFVIKPTGDFTFRLKRGSNNQAFNEGLIQYLESLQKVGLGAHSAPRSLVIEVDFIAKE